MTISELLLEDFDAEMAGTRRTLERIPNEKPDYQCHDKSMPMGRLAMHIATLPLFAKYILTEPSMDMADSKLPQSDLIFKSTEAMLTAFDANFIDARAALAAASDEDLAVIWKFSYGEYVISEFPRSKTFRLMFFNHLIHHRAQLGVYLRLNYLAVPGLYGPSADEPFQT